MLSQYFPRSGSVPVTGGHNIYYEEYGPRTGPAFVMVHGNAGYLFDPQKISQWDLTRQRVVILHMRGIGKSTPEGAVGNNLYPDLAEDIEAVRRHLNLGIIQMFGWSGGTAVSLLYAQTYPQNCAGLTLYGTYLGAAAELREYYERTALRCPAGWRKFCAAYGTQDVMEAVRRSNAAILSGNSLKAVLQYELIFEPASVDADTLKTRFSPEHWDRVVKNRMVFAHMMNNGYGLRPDQLEGDLHKIAHLPVLFVNGSVDHVTPSAVAARLAAKLPLARTIIVDHAGHDVHDPRVQKALETVFRTPGLFPPPPQSPRP